MAEVTRKATGNEKFPQPEDIYYIDPTPLVVGNQLLVSFAIKYPGAAEGEVDLKENQNNVQVFMKSMLIARNVIIGGDRPCCGRNCD